MIYLYLCVYIYSLDIIKNFRTTELMKPNKVVGKETMRLYIQDDF